MRLWGLEAGLPLAASRPLGSTVRCVAADERLIVCATTGDHSIRAWRPSDVRDWLTDMRGCRPKHKLQMRW